MSTSRKEHLTSVGLKRSLADVQKMRLMCCRSKRPTKNKTWVGIGINSRGFCVMRQYTSPEDTNYFNECLFVSRDIQFEFMDAVRDPVAKVGFGISGNGFVAADMTPFSTALYVFANNIRDMTVFVNGIKALASSCKPNGQCIFFPQTHATFDESAVKFDYVPEDTRSKSGRFWTSLGLKKRKESEPAQVSDRSIMSNYDFRDDSFRIDASSEYSYLTSIIHCCNYLDEYNWGESAHVFGMPTEAHKLEEIKVLEQSMVYVDGRKRPNLSGYSADVVEDIMLQCLFNMSRRIIDDNAYVRFVKCVNKLVDLDIDLSLSPAVARATGTLVSSLPVSFAYVLRRICTVIDIWIDNNIATISLAAQVLGGLLVESLQDDIRPSAMFRYGRVDVEREDPLTILFKILCDKMIATDLFSEALETQTAQSEIERIQPVVLNETKPVSTMKVAFSTRKASSETSNKSIDGMKPVSILKQESGLSDKSFGSSRNVTLVEDSSKSKRNVTIADPDVRQTEESSSTNASIAITAAGAAAGAVVGTAMTVETSSASPMPTYNSHVEDSTIVGQSAATGASSIPTSSNHVSGGAVIVGGAAALAASAVIFDEEPKSPMVSDVEPKSPVVSEVEPKSPVVSAVEPKSPVVSATEPKSPVVSNVEPKSSLIKSDIAGGAAAATASAIVTSALDTGAVAGSKEDESHASKNTESENVNDEDLLFDPRHRIEFEGDQGGIASKATDLCNRWPVFQGCGAKFADNGRTSEVSQLIAYYEAKLAEFPESRNAGLWKQEIEDLKHEQEIHILDEDSVEETEKPEGSDVLHLEKNKILASVSKCWIDCKHARIDQLVQLKAAQEVSAPGEEPRKGAARKETQIDPIALFDESDVTLTNLRDGLEMTLKHYRDLTDDDFGDTTVELLTEMLKENIALRMELNQYQRGIVERTQAKAMEFNKQYESKIKDEPAIAPAAAKGPTWTLSGLFG